MPGEFAKTHALIKDFTMSSPARLRALYMAVDRISRLGINGDIVECGTARGGSAGLLGLTMQNRNRNRLLWVFDTFEGLPPPTLQDPDYEIAKNYIGTCYGSLEDVESLFVKLGILDRVRLVKGLFQKTLPHADVGPIAVLHLDGDWYESIKICLHHLYDRVSPGGVIQIDDYGHWEGARKALQEFLYERDIRAPLKYIDYTGRQFIKPASPL